MQSFQFCVVIDRATWIHSYVEDKWLLLCDIKIPLSSKNHWHHIQFRIRYSRNDTAAKRNPCISVLIMWTWFLWMTWWCQYMKILFTLLTLWSGIYLSPCTKSVMWSVDIFYCTLEQNNRRVAGSVGRSCHDILMEAEGSLRNTEIKWPPCRRRHFQMWLSDYLTRLASLNSLIVSAPATGFPAVQIILRIIDVKVLSLSAEHGILYRNFVTNRKLGKGRITEVARSLEHYSIHCNVLE